MLSSTIDTLTNNENVRTFAVRSWAWDNYLNEGSLAEPPQNPNYLEVRSSQEAAESAILIQLIF